MSRDMGKNRGKARAELALFHVRHATFEQLSAAGYEVRTIEDGSAPLDLGASGPNDMPDHWKAHQPTIVPKIATLPEAKLFEDGSALLPDRHYCYTDTSFGREDWRKNHVPRMVFRRIDPELDDALIKLPSRSVSVSGRCFSTLSNHHKNYGHFIHDMMSRIYYEDLNVIAPGREKVIAPPLHHPVQKILFEKVFAGYEIVEARADTAIMAEELVLAANLCSRFSFNPSGIASLSRRMEQVMAPYAAATEKWKVCVSRGDGRDHAGRDFVNAAEFESLMRKLGYRVVEVSTLDAESQFDLWANTTDIVGIHGAGMMNMIMMPRGGNYFEIAGAPSKTYPSGTPNNIVRSAMASGHHANGMASSLDEEERPIIDIERLVEILNDSSISSA